MHPGLQKTKGCSGRSTVAGQPGILPASPELTSQYPSTLLLLPPRGAALESTPILVPGSQMNLPGADTAKPVTVWQLNRGWYNFMAFCYNQKIHKTGQYGLYVSNTYTKYG